MGIKNIHLLWDNNSLKTMEMKFYVAPAVELVEVMVEQGFANSNNDPDIDGAGFPF